MGKAYSNTTNCSYKLTFKVWQDKNTRWAAFKTEIDWVTLGITVLPQSGISESELGKKAMEWVAWISKPAFFSFLISCAAIIVVCEIAARGLVCPSKMHETTATTATEQPVQITPGGPKLCYLLEFEEIKRIQIVHL